MNYIVDEEDKEKINNYVWFDHHGYAMTSINGIKYMQHKLVMNVDNSIMLDHINGNKLDNRKCNLRVATHADNMRNRPKQKGTYSSKYKGVTKSPSGSFYARIKHNGFTVRLGTYVTEQEAAEAYNVKTVQLFGKFAKLNIIERN